MLFIENDNKYSTPIWSRVLALARRYWSSELLGGSAVLILSTVFYLLKQVAVSGRHVVQNDNCSYICVGGIIRS